MSESLRPLPLTAHATVRPPPAVRHSRPMQWLYAIPAWVWVTLIAGPFFAIPALGIGLTFLRLQVEPVPFDSRAWKDISVPTWLGTAERTRGFMARDLLATQDLRGRSCEDILELLGHPDGWYLARSTRPFVYSYQIDPHPLSVDDFWLIVRFDDQDRVESASIECD